MISIDPGTKALGVAQWLEGELCRAWLVRPKGRSLQAKIDSLPQRSANPDPLGVCELMDAGGLRVPPNDLIAVATAGAVYITQQARRVVFVTPQVWKGRVPKDIHHKRIRKALSERETEALEAALDKCPKSYHKEILDAVGIGLWQLGRKA